MTKAVVLGGCGIMGSSAACDLIKGKEGNESVIYLYKSAGRIAPVTAISASIVKCSLNITN